MTFIRAEEEISSAFFCYHFQVPVFCIIKTLDTGIKNSNLKSISCLLITSTDTSTANDAHTFQYLQLTHFKLPKNGKA